MQSAQALIPYSKHRSVFRPRITPVVELGRRDIGMAKQLLDFGNISLMEPSRVDTLRPRFPARSEFPSF